MEENKKYTDYELCKFVVKLEAWLQEDNRAKTRYRLDSHSRKVMYNDFFQPLLGEQGKITEYFFQNCSGFVNRVEKEGFKGDSNVNPLPKVLELIYIFNEHETTKIEGFAEWVKKLSKGKYAYLLEMSLDNQVETIASNVDIKRTLDELVISVDELKEKVERLSRQDAFLNKFFRGKLLEMKNEGDQKVVDAFKRWEKDFQ